MVAVNSVTWTGALDVDPLRISLAAEERDVAEISATDVVAEISVTDVVAETLATASAVLPASPPMMARSAISETGSARDLFLPLPRWSAQTPVTDLVLPVLLRLVDPSRIVAQEWPHLLLGVLERASRVRAPAHLVASLPNARSAQSVYPPLRRRITSGARECVRMPPSNLPSNPATEARPRRPRLAELLPSPWAVRS